METIEQMCRDLLQIAIKDGLVSLPTDFEEGDPQCRSSGELVGVGNYLNDALYGRTHGDELSDNDRELLVNHCCGKFRTMDASREFKVLCKDGDPKSSHWWSMNPDGSAAYFVLNFCPFCGKELPFVGSS